MALGVARDFLRSFEVGVKRVSITMNYRLCRHILSASVLRGDIDNAVVTSLDFQAVVGRCHNDFLLTAATYGDRRKFKGRPSRANF